MTTIKTFFLKSSKLDKWAVVFLPLFIGEKRVMERSKLVGMANDPSTLL